MAIKLSSHLHRARSGILHFRIAIPPDLYPYFTTREIYRSLWTASVQDAAPQAQRLANAFKDIFSDIRQQTMSDDSSPPKAPPFDRARLLEFTKQAQRVFRLRSKIFEQEDEIFRLEQARLKDRRQHERELGLVMQSSRDTASALLAAAVAPTDAVGAELSAAVPDAEQTLPLFSELIEDYKRDRLAANRWTPKTQDENLAVYKLCIDIVGDLPLNEIGEDQALTYVETLKKATG